ncbi:MAG TPA: hypothetical protein VFU19_11485 [Iamia sp.]|nr:hypothetical protein [Iamia sp.]
MDDRTSAPRQRPHHDPADDVIALGALGRFGPDLDPLDPDRVLTRQSEKAGAVVALTNFGVIL